MVNQNTSERQVIETALSIFKNFSNLEDFDSSLSLALKKYFNFSVPSTEINDALHVYNIIEHIKKVSKGIPSLPFFHKNALSFFRSGLNCDLFFRFQFIFVDFLF